MIYWLIWYLKNAIFSSFTWILRLIVIVDDRNYKFFDRYETKTKKRESSDNSKNGDEEVKRLLEGSLAVFGLETPTSLGNVFEA